MSWLMKEYPSLGRGGDGGGGVGFGPGPALDGCVTSGSSLNLSEWGGPNVPRDGRGPGECVACRGPVP